MRPVVNRANEVRAKRDLPPLPAVTAHALRRTYISLMIEAGAPLPYVMSQVGHADSRTTLEVSAQVTGDPAGLGDAETASSGDLDGPRGPRSGPRK